MNRQSLNLFSLRRSLAAKTLPYLVMPILLITGSAQALVVEEVVVTAQKKEENVQNVSLSVSAFSGETLRALGYNDTTEITQQIPNLQLNAWSPNLTIFNIRGVSQNNFTDNLEAPVAVYFDDAYMGSINGISGHLFDMKRTEVARGPQGTLFGRNATGGLIHYLSNGADESETNGYFQLEVGDFSRRTFEGAIGGEIADGVRARFAARWEEVDGYVESTNPLAGIPEADLANVPPPFQLPSSGQDLGGKDGYAARLNIQVDFSDQLTGDFWVKYSKDDNVPTGGYAFERCALDGDGECPVDRFGRTVTQSGVMNYTAAFINSVFGVTGIDGAISADEHDNFGETEGFLDRETTIWQAKFDYQMVSGVQFVSITNFTELEKKYLEDGDASSVRFLNFQTEADYSQFSQEFRWAGEFDRGNWVAGFYYLDIQADGDIQTIGIPAFNPIATATVADGRTRLLAAGGFDSNVTEAGNMCADSPTGAQGGSLGDAFCGAVAYQDYELESQNYSLFTQFEYELADDLKLTAGLRWSQDDKKIDWILTYTDLNNTMPVTIESSDAIAGRVSDADEIDYGDWAGRIALDWQYSEDTLLFASFSRGIKGGNWVVSASARLSAEPNLFQHDEETLYSFEVGFKTQVDDTLRVNGTVYIYDYQDYQAFSLAGGNPFVENTDAEAMGGELEIFWNPNQNLDVILGFAYSDSEVDRVVGAATGGTGDMAVPPITNAELPNAPEYSANYLVRYNLPLGDGSLVAFQLDGAYYDDQYLEVTNGPGTEQESYHVYNARVTYDIGNFSVVGWIKNLGDETYKLYSLDLGTLGTTTFYAPPRTYGVSLAYNF